MKFGWIGIGILAAAALACGDDAAKDDSQGQGTEDAGNNGNGGDGDGDNGDGDSGDGDGTGGDGDSGDGDGDAGSDFEPTEACPANIDPATVDFGITSTDTWTLLGGPQQVNGLPGGARAAWGLVTVTRCGLLVLADNDDHYDAYASSGVEGFTKLSVAPTANLYSNRDGMRGPLRVVDDKLVFRIKTSDNTSHLMTLPLTGGAFETVSSSADETMQIFGFTPAGETSYIMSHYGAGVFSGLLSVPTAKLLDGSFVAADTSVVRAIANQPNSYIHPYGADKLFVNKAVVDPTCTASCTDPALSTSTVQDEPFATEDGLIVTTDYDDKLVVVGPDQPQGVLSSAITGLRTLNDVAMAQGVGVASYDVDNGQADKVVFFSVGASSVEVREAPGMIGKTLSGVWTNGKIALVYSAGANSAVYGIKLAQP